MLYCFYHGFRLNCQVFHSSEPHCCLACQRLSSKCSNGKTFQITVEPIILSIYRHKYIYSLKVFDSFFIFSALYITLTNGKYNLFIIVFLHSTVLTTSSLAVNKQAGIQLLSSKINIQIIFTKNKHIYFFLMRCERKYLSLPEVCNKLWNISWVKGQFTLLSDWEIINVSKRLLFLLDHSPIC